MHMRTTVTIDDDLVARAAEYSGIDEKSKLINFVLDAYIKKMSARRLAALGGKMPDLEDVERGSRTSDYWKPTSMVAEEP